MEEKSKAVEKENEINAILKSRNKICRISQIAKRQVICYDDTIMGENGK